MRAGCYQTLQHQGKERRALARYLKYDLGYNDYQIKETVSKIKSKRKEIFDDDIWDEIMSKLLDKFDKGEYIKDLKVGISESELDVILNQPTTELRDLLWVLTVYFKWARNTKERLCMRGTNEWVKEADLDCCRLAGLERLRKNERIQLFNILVKNKLYNSDYIRRYHSIFTLPFIDDKKPVIIINDYNDIVAHLENYINSTSCIKCEECGSLVRKKTNNQRYCTICKKLYHYNKK